MGNINHGCLGSEYFNDIQGADIAESLVGVRVIADRSGHWAPVLPHAEEDVDAIRYWADC